MPGSERKSRRRRSTQSSPRRQWRRRGAAEEREEKRGSELRASATTGLTKDWEAGTEEAFAREGGTSGGRRQLPGDGGNRERRRRRRRRPTMLAAWTQGRRRRSKRPSGNRERRCRWLGLCGVEKEIEEKEEAPRSMAATASWEAGTGGLMKTETRLTATEKSEGREDPHVVGDGKEEEGERETAAATKFAEDPATASRRRKAVGFAVTADGGGRGRRGRRDGGSPVEERERREEKLVLTASRGWSGGRR